MSASAAGAAAGTLASPTSHTLYSDGQRRRLLLVLFLVSTSNYVDRNIISVLLEPIKREFGVSDTALGLLSGLAFACLYATLGIPVARWADRGNRRRIVTISLVVWSVMTTLCGMAQTFWQLALARIGVGAGEAGAIPPAQSLIADYFAPEQRAVALAIFTASATAGYLIAFVGGAQLVAHWGWRGAFIAVGVPGLLLALVTHLALREPREVLGFVDAARDERRFIDEVRVLASKRSYVAIVVGLTLYGFVAYGVLIFFPSFMIRSLGVSLKDVGAAYGAASAVGALIGTLGGGWLAAALGRRDPRWYAWLPALAMILTLPINAYALTLDTFAAFVALTFVGGILLTAGLPSIFTAMHAVCGSSRRAVATSIMMFMLSLVGAGLGPLVTGLVSDLLAPTLGKEALRWALVAAIGFLAPASLACFIAGRAIPRDAEP